MGSLKRPLFGWIAVILSLVFCPLSRAEDWRNLVQPLGTLQVVETAAVVNARLGGIPPFDNATDVTTIRTSVPQYFVRFYNPTDPVNPSNPVGSWIMRAATVRGLTPAQVRDTFALPAMPTHMTIVLVPAGYNLYTGIAAPIGGWGAGGAQQSKLIGPPWVAAGNFLNQQTLLPFVLSYKLRAGGGNTGNIAAYLDGRIPAAYSDLENVYLSLDLLYTDALAGQFRNSLDQIGPARYDNLTIESLWISGLFNQAVDERVSDAFLRRTGPDEAKPENRMWLKLIGSVQRAGDLGFNSEAKGVAFGGDKAVSERVTAGFSLGFAHSALDWTGAGGSVKTDTVRGGLYSAWLGRDFFFQAGLNAGFSQGDAARAIVFPGAFSIISRAASARLDGWEVNPRLRAGCRLPFKALDVVPAAGLDYFHQHRNGFTETGADSLDLGVGPVRNRTLRTWLGVEASKETRVLKDARITPRLRIGWAREVPLDDRSITARLAGQPDEFSVNGDGRVQDILAAGAGVTLVTSGNFSFFGQYGLELRQGATGQALSAGMSYRF